MSIVTRRNIIRAGSVVGITALAGGGDLVAGGPASAAVAAAPVASAVRPEDFGAVADGQTDCTQAFIAAIAAMNGRTVNGRQCRRALVLSSGVYRVTGTLTIPGMGVIITGTGRQNSVLYIDHQAGDGIVFSGGGDIELRGLTVTGSDSRRKASSGDGIVFLPYAGRKFSFRITVIDTFSTNHPGCGMRFASAEGLRLENIQCSHNGSHGCFIDASKMQDLCNSIEFSRFSDNGDHGLKVSNIMNSRFSRIECLNNHGAAQFALDGTQNLVELPDCECFGFPSPVNSIGLLVSGRCNMIEGGIFYKLNTAIMLKAANDCRIRLPRMEGDLTFHMAAGVQLGADCSRNVLDVVGGNLVTSLITDLGTGNVILRNGRDPGASPLQKAQFSMPISGSVAPMLSAGNVLSLVTDGPVNFLPVGQVSPGDVFTLIVDTQHRGIGSLAFADDYRGVSDVIAANSGSRYLSATFVFAQNGHYLPHSVMAYT